uniref:F-box protein n=1 Tax=Quercus lobata TaxID=97700 RepID=A0A7N2MA67_QUELO
MGESPPEVEDRVEVYSLATGEWKMLTTVPPTGTEFYGHPYSFINGALHWVAFRRTKDNMFLEFVSVLNLEDEVFRKIALPKLGMNGNKLPTFISAYGNSLALFQKVSMDPLSIGLMEEYGNASS